MVLDELLAEIAAEFAQAARWTGREAPSAALMAALAAVPREAFVPESEAALAYINAPLPIGYRQTISQPFIVAIMTELLDVSSGVTVLEIGTGSGYQAAILAELGARVFTIEVIPELAARARRVLARLGYRKVEVRTGDGNLGWPDAAPFDRIIVTAAAPHVPPALVAQLKSGGRMVIPIGPDGGPQTLWVVTKDGKGKLEVNKTLDVAFVPLVGNSGRT